MLTSVTIENFRIHQHTEINDIREIFAIVGKNDVGKSSVLEAMNMHFNNIAFPIEDKNDANQDINITPSFDNNQTTAKYLYFKANNYTDDSIASDTVSDLINRQSTNQHNQERCDNLTQKVNAILTIYECVNNLSKSTDEEIKDLVEKFLDYRDIQVFLVSDFASNSNNPDIKQILDIAKGENIDVGASVEDFVNVYGLFDTSNAYSAFSDFLSEGDSSFIINLDEDDIEIEESRDIKDATETLDDIKERLKKSFLYAGTVNIDREYLDQHSVYENLLVNGQPNEIVAQKNDILKSVNDFCNTLLDSDIATKWKKILRDFANSHNNIPIGKRGSGVQRLCSLFNFAVEKYREISINEPDTIFAIDEPEISLHPNQQRELINRLKEISQFPDFQVFISTHSPYIVKGLDYESVYVLGGTKKDKLLDYNSLNEINYFAFDEPSIEYHVELFCRLESLVLAEYKIVNGKKKHKEKYNLQDMVDDWIEKKDLDKKENDFYQIGTDNKPHEKHQHTLPYCVRNQIGHRNEVNKQYDDKVADSIEILRKAIPIIEQEIAQLTAPSTQS